jgi:dTDP-4-amino-4,6-dideoxygalactose transaminase
VHYGGYPCNMDSIMHIAKRHNLYVVEDVAHAPGAACWMTVEQTSQAQRGKRLQKCGSIGDIGCFSFFSNKNMTTGEGGMLTTNDADLAERIRLLRSHGMTRLTWDRNQGHGFSYDVLALGYNYRIDEIRAAIGSIQLKKLEGNNHKRLEATNFYKETLSNIENMTIPFLDNQSLSSYHIFPILLKNRDKREQFMKFMCNKGIQTSIHYPPVHQFTSYRTSSSRCGLLRTEDIGQREVTLPLYAGIERQQLDYITTSIQEWMVATK